MKQSVCFLGERMNEWQLKKRSLLVSHVTCAYLGLYDANQHSALHDEIIIAYAPFELVLYAFIIVLLFSLIVD
jgi:hypothetical protein